ncbi:hypothetical protein FEP92_05140 [Burkholderia multivorans]|nr:hypothetical protein [Burkholderia multivorans]MDR8861337.1 hypothetical protein [Burkholderia multivorans]
MSVTGVGAAPPGAVALAGAAQQPARRPIRRRCANSMR